MGTIAQVPSVVPDDVDREAVGRVASVAADVAEAQADTITRGTRARLRTTRDRRRPVPGRRHDVRCVTKKGRF
jgi:hypothetical protein